MRGAERRRRIPEILPAILTNKFKEAKSLSDRAEFAIKHKQTLDPGLWALD